MIKSTDFILNKYKHDNPTTLPDGFEWASVDMKNDDELEQVYELLKNNFVEDAKQLMRFEYRREMLKWVTCGPHYNKDLMVGVRSSANKKLFGFLSGMPVTCKING